MLLITNMKQVFINMLLTLQAIKEDNLKHIPAADAADQNTKSLLPHTAKLMVCIKYTQVSWSKNPIYWIVQRVCQQIPSAIWPYFKEL